MTNVRHRESLGAGGSKYGVVVDQETAQMRADRLGHVRPSSLPLGTNPASQVRLKSCELNLLRRTTATLLFEVFWIRRYISVLVTRIPAQILTAAIGERGVSTTVKRSRCACNIDPRARQALCTSSRQHAKSQLVSLPNTTQHDHTHSGEKKTVMTAAQFQHIIILGDLHSDPSRCQIPNTAELSIHVVLLRTSLRAEIIQLHLGVRTSRA